MVYFLHFILIGVQSGGIPHPGATGWKWVILLCKEHAMTNVFRKAFLCAALLGLLCPATGFAADEKISFNKATAQELMEALDGAVDAPLAQAIVEYRTQNGPFKTAEDLRKVPGMSSVIFSSIGPVDEGGDVVYEAEIPTGMHSY